MEIYYSIVFFVFGTIFGSFYNVVGDRLPNNESIIKPRSHCPKCNHQLSALELIPILSYIFLKGRCKNCKAKVPLFHLLYEIGVGLLFMFSYWSFGFTGEFIIALTFISMISIIFVSDCEYMIILDEVLVFFGILLIIEILIVRGVNALLLGILSGIISFIFMLVLKKIGDYIFKTESMGGGDIKLMGLIGLVIGWEMSIFSIFIGSVVGFPISLIVLKKEKTNIIPFGPFLSFGATLILLTHFTENILLNILIR